MMYSLFSGLPVLMIATIGTRIRSHVPGVLSFSDYALRVSIIKAYQRKLSSSIFQAAQNTFQNVLFH